MENRNRQLGCSADCQKSFIQHQTHVQYNKCTMPQPSRRGIDQLLLLRLLLLHVQGTFGVAEVRSCTVHDGNFNGLYVMYLVSEPDGRKNVKI